LAGRRRVVTDLIKGTKAYGEDVAYVFYGINRDTLDVEAVRYTRDHDLSRLNRDGSITRHHVDPRQIAETEVKMAYGLTDVMMVPISLATTTHAGIVRLEVKAASMRSRREGTTTGNA
jgi:hypothetical protein